MDVLTHRELTARPAEHAPGRQGDRRRNGDISTEAIVSSDDRRRMKGAAPAIRCALFDHA
jgi:hypothetical protein